MTKGDWGKMIQIDKEKCIGCGLCSRDCVSSILEIRDKKAVTVSDKCILCGHCIAVCPKNAVSIEEYDMSEVVELPKEACSIPSDLMINTIKFRRSIRHFKENQVDKEKIERIIEAGRYSPTGSNSQNVSYIVVEKDLDLLREEAMKSFRKVLNFAKKTNKFFKVKGEDVLNRINLDKGDFLFKGAKTLILVVSESPVNGSIASANMELVANSEGVGVLYVGFFTSIANRSRKIKKILNITGKKKIVACLAIGYPDIAYKRTAPRKKAKIEWR